MNNNLKELKNKIEQNNKLIVEFKTPLIEENKNLIKQMQELCPHNNVKKTGGGMWHSWPDYGHYPYHVECLDCGLFGSSNDKDYLIYGTLNQRVTIDESKKS